MPNLPQSETITKLISAGVIDDQMALGMVSCVLMYERSRQSLIDELSTTECIIGHDQVGKLKMAALLFDEFVSILEGEAGVLDEHPVDVFRNVLLEVISEVDAPI
jgi:hypothetical protein